MHQKSASNFFCKFEQLGQYLQNIEFSKKLIDLSNNYILLSLGTTEILGPEKLMSRIKIKFDHN